MFLSHRSEDSLFLFRRFVQHRRALPAVSLILFAGVLAVAPGKAQTPTPPPHGNFAEPPQICRGPYEYSAPGHATDFTPQNEPEISGKMTNS